MNRHSFRPLVAASSLLLLGVFTLATSTAEAGAKSDPDPSVAITEADSVLEATGVAPYLMTPEERDALTAQQLAERGDELQAAAAVVEPSVAGNYPDAFGGIVVNPATLTLDLWWTGGEETDVTRKIRQAAPEVTLRWHEATYSRNELLTRIEKTRSDMRDVQFAFPRQDGSGVVVTHTSDTDVDADAIAKALGVPVIVAVEGKSVEDNGGRQQDTAPHNGGAMLIHGSAICSTGFSVVDGANNGYLLSAAHCDTTGNWAWDNGAGTQLTPGGSAVSVVLSLDSMLINPVGGTSGYVYSGGVNSTDRRAVSGTATNNVGESVTLSGANSGEHTGLNIVNDAYSATCNGYSCTLIRANGANNDEVSAGGDSGGPVYHIKGDGGVTAKGIDHGHVGDLAQQYCTPQKYPGNACGDNVIYAPIRPVIDAWGSSFSIETHN